jgi:hypothetical protein
MAQILFSQTLIHRFVRLLTDSQIELFINHLNETNALLPKKLVETVHRHPDWEAKEVYKAVYGAKKNKHNLNQLISYTFKLSEWMAINYPFYLTHNIVKLNDLVIEGKLDDATQLAENTLYIAQKTCDYSTQIAVLKFLTQQSYLHNQNRIAVEYHNQLMAAVEDEATFQRLQFIFRTRLHPANIASIDKVAIKNHLEEMVAYFEHRSIAVALLSKLMHVQVIHYFFPEKFLTKKSLDFIERLEKDLNNHTYLVLPILFDFRSYLNFLKLNSILFDINSLEGKRLFREMERHSSQIAYWNHYLNIPELYVLSGKASYYLTKYHHHLPKSDYNKLVSNNDLKELKSLTKSCNDLLNKNDWRIHYYKEYLHLVVAHSVLIMISDRAKIDESNDQLERLLTAYQQVNITGSIDSIFVVLMIGYFAKGDYIKLEESFHRYIKLIKKNPMYEDNDIVIHIYYYLGQWLRHKRKQYIDKLLVQYNRASADPILFEDAYNSVKKLTAIYAVPIEFPKAK